MNVFRFELKQVIPMVVGWTIGILLVLYFMIIGVYPIFRDGIELLESMIAKMPAELLSTFGFDIELMLQYTGFYGFITIYIGLIGAIMASNVGITIFAREKKNKCRDFLFVKPIEKYKLYWIKFLAGFCTLLLFNLIYAGISLWLFDYYNEITVETICFSFSLFATQIVFYALGIFVAVYKRKVRTYVELASTIGFGAFVLSSVVRLLDEKYLNYLSPLHYFSVMEYLQDNKGWFSYLICGVVAVLCCIVVSLCKYKTEEQ